MISGRFVSEMTVKERVFGLARVVGKLLMLAVLLYMFICSLGLMSDGFRLLGGRAAGQVFQDSQLLRNPICGVIIGVLATVLLQSSSTSTSIVVSMVASESTQTVRLDRKNLSGTFRPFRPFLPSLPFSAFLVYWLAGGFTCPIFTYPLSHILSCIAGRLSGANDACKLHEPNDSAAARDAVRWRRWLRKRFVRAERRISETPL